VLPPLVTLPCTVVWSTDCMPGRSELENSSYRPLAPLNSAAVVCKGPSAAVLPNKPSVPPLAAVTACRAVIVKVPLPALEDPSEVGVDASAPLTVPPVLI